MTEQELDILKYPIGMFEPQERVETGELESWIKVIADFPAKLSDLTGVLNVERLNWKYRPGGWTIKQVVHHCADSHMNSYIRFKLALTEVSPIIRPYLEERWAELDESKDDEIVDSLKLITALHSKWVQLIESLNESQLNLSYVHPETGQSVTLDGAIGLYAWHYDHHRSHITHALESNGKYNL